MSGLTYDEVGATLADRQLPLGYHHLCRTACLGSGRATFDRAAGRLMRWELQRGAGVRVRPTSEQVAVGVEAVQSLGIGPFALRAPVRVVAVVDEPRRRGFAYGTLAGHPETGEESFVVEHGEDDSVVVVVTAFSRPATLLSRLGGPLTSLVQSRITDRYLEALG
jgi:uncharacterized protein (UPF0548 family)